MIRKNKNRKKIGFYIKRIFDVIISLISLIILFPIFTISGILIKLDSDGPIFFRQERIGKSGKIFKIYKFRTMVLNAKNIGLGFSTHIRAFNFYATADNLLALRKIKDSNYQSFQFGMNFIFD